MKNLILGMLLLAVVFIFPVPTMAWVNVGVNISLPPLIVFEAPPEMIVIPETYVYVVPDVDVDIFFYNGWWWRPWDGRWYRSRDYNSGWRHYRKVPSFYRQVPSEWRNDYREHHWRGHQWNYQRIPHKRVQGKWSYWKETNHWEKQQTWGVQGLQPRTHSQQPSRKVQPQQSRPRSQKLTPQRSQQHREAEPQYHENQSQQSQQSHQQQGKHEKGNGNGNGKK